ncbi:MAG: CPBP family intramembrane metalloprotease [Lachnospiraceae bacterium]|nr:CPBP family intramembrane metalloprotease [Lachnospiraceae bacterium]
MKKIYEKNEVTFAILSIVIYVVGTSAAEALAETMGIVKLPAMVFHVAFTVLLLLWLKKNALFEKYGLMLPEYKPVRAWFYIPLMLIGLSSIFFGVTLKYSVPETVFYIVSMLCVGFLEEVIFRGFLFVGMAKQNRRVAIIVSSITFGIGHIVNLLNGQDLLETLLQIVFAVAVGFMLVILFYKGKSLLPCIIFHGINNAVSAISDENASLRFFGTVEKELWITVSIAIVIAVVYSIAMWKSLGSVSGKNGSKDQTDTGRGAGNPGNSLSQAN